MTFCLLHVQEMDDVEYCGGFDAFNLYLLEDIGI